MADYVDDSCNLSGNANSNSDISLNNVGFVQTNQSHLCNGQPNDKSTPKQQLSDVSNICFLLFFLWKFRSAFAITK